MDTGGEKPSSVLAETVLKLAALARIELTAAEAAAFEGQFRSILGHFRQLSNAPVTPDTNFVGPLGGEDLLRDDTVTSGSFREDFLAGVPRRSGEFVVVPAVLPHDAAGSPNSEN